MDTIKVQILDRETGETISSEDYSYFWWAQGNGSCDCNRRILFGLPMSDECVSERFVITHALDEDGNSIEDELNEGYSR